MHPKLSTHHVFLGNRLHMSIRISCVGSFIGTVSMPTTNATVALLKTQLAFEMGTTRAHDLFF